jgi:hypothetical protein
LQQVMQAARRGEYHLLIVWRYDGLSRVKVQQDIVLMLLRRYGVQVISTTQPVPEGMAGNMLQGMYAFASQVEHEGVTSRLYEGRRARTEHGLLPGAPHALYGLSYADAYTPGDKGRYIKDSDSIDGKPEHAPGAVVHYVYRLCIGGRSERAIARTLEADGIPTPSQVLAARGELPTGRLPSRVWRTSTIGRILRNPAYTGAYVAWRDMLDNVALRDAATGERVGKERIVRRPDGDAALIPMPAGVVEPLVTPEMFQAAQVALAQHKGERDARRRVRDAEGALLAGGFAHCGYCGRRMTKKWSRTDNAYRYFCSASSQGHVDDRAKCPGGSFSWQAPKVDTLTWRWLITNVKHPELLHAKHAKWQVTRGEQGALEADTLEVVTWLLEGIMNLSRRP